MNYLLAAMIAVSALACGDNATAPDGSETLEEVLVVPHLDESITALESLEEAGFVEPIYIEDEGYILAFGSLGLIDDAEGMPGIDEIILSRDAAPFIPELGIDLVDPSPESDFSDLQLGPGEESRID